MMTDEERADLRAMSMDIAGAENSKWQPRCICAAFAKDANAPAPRFVLTMQRWINLERVRSPILEGTTPDTLETLEQALRAFEYEGPSELEVDEWAVIAREMVEAHAQGFSTIIQIRPEETDSSESGGNDGFGVWAPLLACLIVQVGLPLETALSLPVAQAYVLMASMRHNQGWKVKSESYAMRDMKEDRDG